MLETEDILGLRLVDAREKGCQNLACVMPCILRGCLSRTLADAVSREWNKQMVVQCNRQQSVVVSEGYCDDGCVRKGGDSSTESNKVQRNVGNGTVYLPSRPNLAQSFGMPRTWQNQDEVAVEECTTSDNARIADEIEEVRHVDCVSDLGVVVPRMAAHAIVRWMGKARQFKHTSENEQMIQR